MTRGRKTTAARSTRRAGLLVAVGIGAVVIVGILVLSRGGDPAADGPRILTPVTRFGDVHGIAVNPEAPGQLFVATHYGLMRGDNGTGWVRVGEAQDDYMGFSMHPTDGDTFWTSGHPRGGGNIGVQQSTDGGYTWHVLALEKAADFHAMTVSPADPTHLWGYYRGQVYASLDAGNTWSVVDAEPPQLFSLAADPKDPSTVWGAASTGLVRSADGGKTWITHVNAPFQGLGFARDGKKAYVVGQGGSATSADGGATWTPMPFDAQGGTPAHVAVDPTDGNVVYVATYQSAIHESVDGGATWRLVKRAT